jgi:uncharacterized protein (TIGR02646 family)
MKQIAKNNEPQAIIDWKDDASDEWQPTYRDAPKPILRQNLAGEQGYICCYCNQDISDDDFHIEHFRPQHPYTDLELEYVNLHASCIKNKPKGSPSHCGDAKGNWFDNTLTLSPLENNESSFRYSYNGDIEAAIPNASDMIEQLNLKDESLKAKRLAELSGILDENFIESASNAELLTLFDRVSRKIDGKYQPFLVAIQQQIKQLLPANLAVNL